MFCLHIWRHINTDIPVPPSEMVGSVRIGEMKEGDLSEEIYICETSKAYNKLHNDVVRRKLI